MRKTLLTCILVFIGITISRTNAQCTMMNSMHQSSRAKTDTLSQKEVKTGYYQCPMHKEVISDKPGQCFKCGMDLEKKEVAEVEYTCPMHPEIFQTKPGHCPKCLMELVQWDPKRKPMNSYDNYHSGHTGGSSGGGGCH